MNFALLAIAGIFGASLFVFKNEVGEAVSEAVAGEPKNWRRFDDLYKKYGTRWNVPWQWLKSIALNESDNGNYPSVALGLREPANISGSKSQDGLSWGLMQVTIKTARGLDAGATEEKLNNPEYSINLSAKYLCQLSSQFAKPDLRYTEWTIKSYNQGPGNTRKEISTGKGYADEYWTRFQRNLAKVEALS